MLKPIKQKNPEPKIPELKKEDDNFLSLFGENLTGGIENAWLEWVRHRKEKRKPITETMAKKQIEFLIKQPNPALCIETSIRNGWQGLFEVNNAKNKRSNNPRNFGRSSDDDGFDYINAGESKN